MDRPIASMLIFYLTWALCIQEVMEQMKAPGNTVLVLHVTLKLRETTTPEDVHAMRKAIAGVMERRCSEATASLLKAAEKLGMDVQGSMNGNPSR